MCVHADLRRCPSKLCLLVQPNMTLPFRQAIAENGVWCSEYPPDVYQWRHQHLQFIVDAPAHWSSGSIFSFSFCQYTCFDKVNVLVPDWTFIVLTAS